MVIPSEPTYSFGLGYHDPPGTEQPLKEIFALASLVVNLDRKIDGILTASTPALEVVADTVGAASR